MQRPGATWQHRRSFGAIVPAPVSAAYSRRARSLHTCDRMPLCRATLHGHRHRHSSVSDGCPNCESSRLAAAPEPPAAQQEVSSSSGVAAAAAALTCFMTSIPAGGLPLLYCSGAWRCRGADHYAAALGQISCRARGSRDRHVQHACAVSQVQLRQRLPQHSRAQGLSPRASPQGRCTWGGRFTRVR